MMMEKGVGGDGVGKVEMASKEGVGQVEGIPKGGDDGVRNPK